MNYLIDFAFWLVFLLYILTHWQILGYATGLLFWLYIILSFLNEKSSKQGALSLIKIFAYFLIAWIVFTFVLNSKAPIAVIASCSMMPVVPKGSVVFIANYGMPSIPIIQTTEKEIHQLYGPSFITYQGQNITTDSSFLAECMKNPTSIKCEIFKKVKYEQRGPFIFIYENCKRGDQPTLCARYLIYKNKTYPLFKGPVFAFRTRPDDSLANLQFIVHRAVLSFQTEKDIYYMSKGDNSEVPDVIGGMVGRRTHLVDKDRIIGVVFFEIPYIGYLRMLPLGFVGGDFACLNYLN